MIETGKELARWLDRARGAPWIGLDTEADSFHSYPSKLCLLQLSLPGEGVLIDPLAPLDLSPLWDRLGKAGLIIHAADYDLRLLAKHHGFLRPRVFDTMWAARLLGFKEFGLSHLVQRFHQVKLEKELQRADWGKRPLGPKMEEYALNDVRYLHSLRRILSEQLARKGRLEWLQEVGEALGEEAVRSMDQEVEDPWRIKGSKDLAPRAQAFLRELWGWREKEACRCNRPPFFVLSHDRLLQISICCGEGKGWRKHIPRRFSRRRILGLAKCVEAAGAMPSEDWPKPPPKAPRRQGRGDGPPMEAMRKIRDARAGELGIDPTIIASKSTLLALSRDRKGSLPRLMRWQRRLLELE